MKERIAKQKAELRKPMLEALRSYGLTEPKLNDWLEGEAELEAETLDALDGWLRGEFGISTGNWFRRRRNTEANPLSSITPLRVKGPSYKEGPCQTSWKINPGRPGKDLPDASDLVRLQAMKKQQEETEAQRNKDKPTVMKMFHRVVGAK